MRVVVGSLGLAFFAVMGASSVRAAPLEVYGRLPNIEQIKISPDGKLLAMEITDGKEHTVVITDLAAHKMIGGFRAGARKVRGIAWAGPNHLLTTTSVTTVPQGVIASRGEWFMVTDYNVATKQQTLLMDDLPQSILSMNVVRGEPDVRILGGHPIVFIEGVHFVDGAGVDSLFKIDLDRHATEIAAEASPTTDGWVVDGSGAPVAQTLYDADAKLWTLKLRQGDGWAQAKSVKAAIETPQLLGLGRDGRSVLLRILEDGRTTTREFAPGAHDWGDPVADRADGFVFDPATEKLIGVNHLEGDQERYQFFAPADQAMWDSTARAFPNARVTLVSWTQDRKKLVVYVDSNTEAPAYALVDVDAHHAEWLGQPYATLRPEDISPKSAIGFKAADGLELSGYLTIPHGKEAKDLPLIVFPHGGPAVRDEPGFDWWAQAMASRGYAVLQVNYRGSDGFGWDFLKAGFGEWGRKMQTDLSDGVRYLAAQGTIDPKRVCIVGGSYGGYAALAGATLDRGVYRCSASIAGLSDLRVFVALAKEHDEVVTQRYWSRFMGGDEAYDAYSPARHVDGIKTRSCWSTARTTRWCRSSRP